MRDKTFYGLTIDPLHVGAGGYRLGRVDNTIVRDPGTNLPKVPGSSISGVCRNYSIYGLSDAEKQAAVACANHTDNKVKNNCGRCFVCQTFGFASGKDSKNQIGKLKFFDASIVAFPVATMTGPVWVTCKRVLTDLGLDNVAQPGNEELLTSFTLQANMPKLNLGWLYLAARHDNTITLPQSAGDSRQIRAIKDKLVLAPDWLFPEIVNNNLEVRTSVSIEFETGAAKDGALFTYEAIPRATLLSFDVVCDTYRCSDAEKAKAWEMVNGGLGLFGTLGLGGMNTRGFGRMKIVNLD